MSAPITEAHKALWTKLYNLAFDEIFDDYNQSSDGPAHQLIADSEENAVQTAMLREYGNLCATNESLAKERDQLRADCENETKWAAHYLADAQNAIARAEGAEAEVKQLKADGAASAFIDMSCRASRAETDRNNLRADLDAIKSILNEETNRAERAEAELKAEQDNSVLAEAELAAERARLDWLEDNSVCYHVCIDRQPDGYSIHNSPPSPGSVRAAIDAAMKENK